MLNALAAMDLAQLLGVNLDGLSFEEVRPLLDKAVAEGRWLILAGHEIGEGGFQTTRAATLAGPARHALTPGAAQPAAPGGDCLRRGAGR